MDDLFEIKCGCPIGCAAEAEKLNPIDAARVHCTNLTCSVSSYMHLSCCQRWEQDLHDQLQSKWQYYDNQQDSSTKPPNVWEDEGALALLRDAQQLMCACKHGSLTRQMSNDTTSQCRSPQQQDSFEEEPLSPTQRQQQSNKRLRRRNTGSRGSGNNGAGGTQTVGAQGKQYSLLDNISVVLPGRPRARTLSTSTMKPYKPASTNSGPLSAPLRKTSDPLTSNNATQQHPKSQQTLTGGFFDDPQVQKTGSIFISRKDMSAFYAVLPPWKVNGLYIKMEDDCPQGNDDTRIFVLSNLGKNNRRQVPCVLCARACPVYSSYPLIDGTFFVSHVNHRNFATPVRFDGKPAYLNALCVQCCEHASVCLQCVRCARTTWLPRGTYVMGGVYSYDVLSSVQCCAPPCRNCAQPQMQPNTTPFYSSFSEPSQCQRCGLTDRHHIRHITANSVRFLPFPSVGGGANPINCQAPMSHANTQQQQHAIPAPIPTPVAVPTAVIAPRSLPSFAAEPSGFVGFTDRPPPDYPVESSVGRGLLNCISNDLQTKLLTQLC